MNSFSIKEMLERFVKTTATRESSLAAVFSGATEGLLHGVRPKPYQYLYVPAPVYQRCWQMHKNAVLMVNAFDQVMRNEEHALIMNEGYDLGYRMPDIQMINAEIVSFKEVLGEIGPDRTKNEMNGYIKVPAEEALYFAGLVNYNAMIISRIFDAAFNTEYLRPFTNYRKAGYKYQGPNALQGTMDLLVGVARLALEIEKQVETGKQRRDWVRGLSYQNQGNSLDGQAFHNDIA